MYSYDDGILYAHKSVRVMGKKKSAYRRRAPPPERTEIFPYYISRYTFIYEVIIIYIRYCFCTYILLYYQVSPPPQRVTTCILFPGQVTGHCHQSFRPISRWSPGRNLNVGVYYARRLQFSLFSRTTGRRRRVVCYGMRYMVTRFVRYFMLGYNNLYRINIVRAIHC